MEKQSIVLDFSEQAIRKVAFTNSKEEADRLKKEFNMQIYFPSELANFEKKTGIYVLLDG